MMDDTIHKRYFIKLQLLSIVSGSHDASGSSKGYFGYKYYSRQHQNQAKNRITAECYFFANIDSRTGQVVYMIKVNSYKKRLWGLNSQVRDNSILTIGSYITIFNPLPILNRLGDEIPIL